METEKVYLVCLSFQDSAQWAIVRDTGDTIYASNDPFPTIPLEAVYTCADRIDLDKPINELKAVYHFREEDSSYLGELAQEVWNILSDPHRIAEHIIDLWAISGAGYTLAKHVIDKLKSRKSDDLMQFDNEFQKVVEYLSRAKKSRLTEISENTGIPKERVSPMLEYGKVSGMFVCDSNFWHLTAQPR